MGRQDTMEELLAEIEANIIPIQLFYHKIKSGDDPFQDIPDYKSRKLKRKWRKLKKKYGVKKFSLGTAGAIIKRNLREKFLEKNF